LPTKSKVKHEDHTKGCSCGISRWGGKGSDYQKHAHPQVLSAGILLKISAPDLTLNYPPLVLRKKGGDRKFLPGNSNGGKLKKNSRQ